MNVRIVRLITSEELIGDWNRETNTISNPVVMVPVSKEQIGFTPWIPYAKEEDIVLKEEHILSVLTPDTKLANEYNRVYGSGLVLPNEDLVH